MAKIRRILGFLGTTTFWYGVGSLLDLSGHGVARPRPRAGSDWEALVRDGAALGGDWEAVGKDLRVALDMQHGRSTSNSHSRVHSRAS